MSTALVEKDLDAAIAERFGAITHKIDEMRESFMPLVIRGIDDTVGFKAVHAARMTVKNHRVAVEKRRKELKEDALRYGQAVDAAAKNITALLSPIEDHLASEEKTVNEEKERIKNAERLRIEAEEKAKREAEEARLKAERDAEIERMRIEREKLAEQQRVLDEEKRKIEAERKRIVEHQAEQQRAIDAEKRRLADIESARLRAIENERIRTEAAEKARLETEQRIAREAAEAKAKREAEEAAKLRIEQLRPDRDKLLVVADSVAAIDIPAVSMQAAKCAERIKLFIHDAAATVRRIVDEEIK
jgi:DNA repair exonuclease SbcCD ATPase subunit